MPIASVLILAREDALAEELAAPLDSGGFAVTRKSSLDHLESMGDEQAPDLVLLDWGLASLDETHALVDQCRALQIPCILILSYGDLASFDVSWSSSDLLLTPIQPQELLTRVRLLLRHSKAVDSHSIVRVGDLSIDQERYEVAVGGRRVMLTFKEYQLLTLLAANPGRVYTRETLRRNIWEYDYFGGTRTVDVHVRRLRSKIEDADHSFIETVRNVGYRFRPEDSRTRRN